MDDVSLQKLRAEVARDLAPVRPLRPAWMRALLLLPCAALGFALLARLFPGWQVNGLAWAVAGLQLLVAYGILWVGLREAVPGQGPGLPALGLAALVATLTVGGSNALLLALRPMDVPPGLDWPFVVHCFRIELLLGLPAVALGFWLATRGFPLRPVVAGLLGGLSAGVAASGIWSLFCPVNELLHLVASHIGPIVAVALAGFFAGAWWSRRQLARRRRHDLV
ncbi:MAG TPA: hypothetical protein DD490_22995 [Acidobacteria bacterium]|nr:hypothetical protein [Acidobacteriota bacterium]